MIVVCRIIFMVDMAAVVLGDAGAIVVMADWDVWN
jgi:hypothetical protein